MELGTWGYRGSKEASLDVFDPQSLADTLQGIGRRSEACPATTTALGRAYLVADLDVAGAEDLGVDACAGLGAEVAHGADPVVLGGHPEGGAVAPVSRPQLLIERGRRHVFKYY
jgi:hypothetical protein